MPRKPLIRQCLRCGLINPGSALECGDCHAPLIKPRFRMDAKRIKRVHAIAYGRKGLSESEYRDVLAGLGIKSCKEMKQRHYREFMRRMNKLPDAAAWLQKHSIGGRHESHTLC